MKSKEKKSKSTQNMKYSEY